MKWLVVGVLLVGMTACDSGYGVKITNPCDHPLDVEIIADPENGTGANSSGEHAATTIAADSDTTLSTIDDDSESYGILLLTGPRAGEVIRSSDNGVVIPSSACL